jgi:coiled-coil domain-containing protein 12
MDDSSESIAERKKRLASIRLEASRSEVSQGEKPQGEAPETLVRFRNYVPHDSSLDQKGSDRDTYTDSGAAVAKRRRGGDGETIEDLNTGEVGTTDLVKRELEKQKRLNKQASSFDVLPKKLDSDLKALVSGKLQKLQRRTQRTIVEIMRAKLAAPE